LQGLDARCFEFQLCSCPKAFPETKSSFSSVFTFVVEIFALGPKTVDDFLKFPWLTLTQIEARNESTGNQPAEQIFCPSKPSSGIEIARLQSDQHPGSSSWNNLTPERFPLELDSVKIWTEFQKDRHPKDFLIR
jgi:hypothetical protein